ncbi:MAG: TRAP transporter small permease [Alphaproteobacteria bacterium]|nr:TRAP transporter small permease [Alphaproteobacteria bacterium]
MNQPSEGGGRRPALIDRLGDGLSRVCLAIAAAALLGIVAINGSNIVARYIFIAPFSWAEELMLFLMILSVFSGAVAITWRNMHIRIDTFVDMAGPGLRRAIMAVGSVVAIAAIAVIVQASAKIVSILHTLDQRSDALEVPSWIPQSFLTIGLSIVALLMAVRTVLAFVRAGTERQGGQP